jgi:hypothetical protein
MALGLGWAASTRACANHWAATMRGFPGKGSGKVSVQNVFMLVFT